MSSQALYRKWRSQTFDELVGQEAVVETLKNALSSGKLAHAYLFTGPRGTGKTTTARLLAKTINCQQPRNGEPCNQCQQCREITAGTSFDVIEIDAASNRGIDNIRELREKVLVRPTSARYRVYVLDEAHMLTTEAFNALLKTLEEPPEYAVFVLATTDMHKMPPTVISRCQCFYFKRFTTRQIIDHLQHIATQEGITLEQGAAELIARAAAGGMRDALSLLDQAIAYAGEHVSVAQVQAMLGVADPRAIQKFILHVAEGDSAAGLHLVHELAEAGADLRQVNAQVVEFWRALMLARAGAAVAEILDRSDEEIREIQALATHFTLEELTEFARICAQNELLQKGLGTPQLALELALLDCLEVRRRLQRGESPRSATSAMPPAPSVQARLAEPPRVDSVASAPAMPAPVTGSGRPRPMSVAPLPRAVSIPGPLPSETPSPASHLPAAQATAAPASLTLDQVEQAWTTIKRRVKQKDHKTASCLEDFQVVALEESAGHPVVVIQAEHQPHYDFLNQKNRHKPVEQALELQFGLKCQVRLLAPGQPALGRTLLRRNQQTGELPVENGLSFQPPTVERPLTASPSPQVEPPTGSPLDDDVPPPPLTPLVRSKIVAHNDSESARVADKPSARQGEGSAASTPPQAARGGGRNVAGPPSLGAGALRERASADPRVQEVVKTFGAEIVDIDIDRD
jgi:DNA polymerase-3 subunit gamma/tau